jgi:hypothetical protein
VIITVYSTDASEPDCLRSDYHTVVDGKEHLLTWCALGSYYTHLEIVEAAQRLFGADVVVEYAPGTYIQTEPLR